MAPWGCASDCDELLLRARHLRFTRNCSIILSLKLFGIRRVNRPHMPRFIVIRLRVAFSVLFHQMPLKPSPPNVVVIRFMLCRFRIPASTW